MKSATLLVALLLATSLAMLAIATSSLSESVPEMINPSDIPSIYCYPWIYYKGSIYTVNGELVAAGVPYTGQYYCSPGAYLLLLLPDETIYIDKNGAHIYNVNPEVLDPLTGLLVVSKSNGTYMVLFPGTGSVLPFSTKDNRSKIISVSTVNGHPIVLLYSMINNYTYASIITDTLTKKSIVMVNMTPLLLTSNRLYLEDGLNIVHVYVVRVDGTNLFINETYKIDAGIELRRGMRIDDRIVFIDRDGYVYLLENGDLRLVGRGVVTMYGVVSGSMTTTWDGTTVPGIIKYRCGDVYVTSKGLYSTHMVKINVTDRIRISVKVCGFTGEVSLNPGLYVLPIGTVIVYNGEPVRLEEDITLPAGLESIEKPLMIKSLHVVRLSVTPVKVYRGVVSIGYGYGKVGIVLPDKVVVISPSSIYVIKGSYKYYIPGPGIIDSVGDIGALMVTKNGEPVETIGFNTGGRGVPVHGILHPTTHGYEIVYVGNDWLFHIYRDGVDKTINEYYESPDTYLVIRTKGYNGVESIIHTPYGVVHLPGRANISGTMVWVNKGNISYVIDSSTGDEIQIIIPKGSWWVPITLTKGVLVERKGNETIAYLYDLDPVIYGSFVDIHTIPFNSIIIVNGIEMGTGHVRIYGHIGDRYVVRVMKKWYYPNESIIVVKRNPYNVTIHLRRMYGKVLLEIDDLPSGETGIVSINGHEYRTTGSLTLSLPMGETYTIALIDDTPYHICYRTQKVINLTATTTRIVLKCVPRTGVLILKSLYNGSIVVNVFKKNGVNESSLSIITQLSMKPLSERTVYLLRGEYVIQGPGNQTINVFMEPGKIVKIKLKPTNTTGSPKTSGTVIVVTGTKGALVVIYRNRTVIDKKTIPFKTVLEPGSYILFASKTGYRPKMVKLVITGKEKTKNITIILEPRQAIPRSRKSGGEESGVFAKIVGAANTYKYYILIGTLLSVTAIIYIRQKRR